MELMFYLCIEQKKINKMETKVKEVIEVTIPEFVNVIINEVETKLVPPFLSITSEVPLTSMVKKCKEDGSINPYYKEITKEVTKTYLLVTNYEKRVNSNINKEGIEENHDLKELKGRRHVSKSVLIDNETNSIYYLMVEQFMEIKPSEVTYRHNGNEIDKMFFEKWLMNYDNYTNQLQDRKVQVLTPKISNMSRVSVNGKIYLIG